MTVGIPLCYHMLLAGWRRLSLKILWNVTTLHLLHSPLSTSLGVSYPLILETSSIRPRYCADSSLDAKSSVGSSSGVVCLEAESQLSGPFPGESPMGPIHLPAENFWKQKKKVPASWVKISSSLRNVTCRLHGFWIMNLCEMWTMGKVLL